MTLDSFTVLEVFLKQMPSQIEWSPTVRELYARALTRTVPDSIVPALISEMKRRHPKWRPSDSEVKLLAEELLQGAAPTPEQIVAEIRAKISESCSTRTYQPSWARRKRPAPALTFSHPLVRKTVDAAGGWSNVLEIARTPYFDLRVSRCVTQALAGGVGAPAAGGLVLSGGARPVTTLTAAASELSVCPSEMMQEAA